MRNHNLILSGVCLTMTAVALAGSYLNDDLLSANNGIESNEIETTYDHFYPGEISEERKLELDELVIQAAETMSTEHPRLFGTQEKFYADLQYFDVLDPNCEFQGGDGYGELQNAKDMWDKYTRGGEACTDDGVPQAFPSSLYDIKDAEFYLEPEGDKWDLNRALRTVFLMRRVDACLSFDANCIYDATELDALKTAFINYEIDRLVNSPRSTRAPYFFVHWHKGSDGTFFDLGSGAGFPLWSLILDFYWDDDRLSAGDRSFVETEMEKEIDTYIANYQAGHWSLYNGNNWTVILNDSAMHWALTFYHESEKAREVLRIALETNWLHRDIYLDEGQFKEGAGYSGTDFDAVQSQNIFLTRTLGQPLHAMKWAVLEDTAEWMMDNAAPDGLILSFGDTHPRRGFAHAYPLTMLAWQESTGMVPVGEQDIDPCLAGQYFMNVYYDHAFYNPWEVDLIMARDWYSFVSQCPDLLDLKNNVYANYGEANFRTGIPNATIAGQRVDEKLVFLQADQTLLAMTGVDTAYPHREVDFGSVIWSAFGSRLIQDWDYGDFTNGYNFYLLGRSKGYFVLTSENDVMEFYIRPNSDEVQLTSLETAIKVDYAKSGFLDVVDYLAEPDADGWMKATIPVTAFGIADHKWDDNDGDNSWNGPGIGQIFFKLTGGVGKGSEIAIDEVRFRGFDPNSGSEIANLLWYGDDHEESAQGTAFTMTQTDEFYVYLSQDGGAEGTEKTMVFGSNNRTGQFGMYYADNGNDREVGNHMDTFPIGANTLIIPDAREEDDSSTYTGQLWNNEEGIDRAGTTTALLISSSTGNNFEAALFDGSNVYGANEPEGSEYGFMDRMHRYLVSLGNGNYLVVDDFQTKEGKSSQIQEFWFSKVDDIDGCDKSTVGISLHVDVTQLNDYQMLYDARCNLLDLQGTEAESVGRITAASMNDQATFKMGAPDFLASEPYFKRFLTGENDEIISLVNILNDTERRTLVRFEPDVAVSEDVRAFLFQSATSEAALEPASLSVEPCGETFCVTVMIGDQLEQLDFNF